MSEIKKSNELCDASGEDSAGEMTWPKPVFNEQHANLSKQNSRLVKKKRVHYNSFSHAGTNGLTLATSDTHSSITNRPAIGNRAPYGKNSRKSRNGFKQPSKNRGGKDTWNRVSDELDELELDHGDPDYDSEENDSVIIQPINSVLNDADFEEFFSSLVHEYYDHCQVNEVINGLKEIAISPLQRRRLPFLAINHALQQKMSHCELTSELLSEMCGKIISMSGMQQGFQMILDELSDIVLDVPKAPEYVGRFIARAVADDILPPKFVQNCKESNAALFVPLTNNCFTGSPPNNNGLPIRITSRCNSGGNTQSSSGVSSNCESLSTTAVGIGSSSATGDAPVNYAMQAIEKAESLLTLSHAYSRLDIVWGIHPCEQVTTMLMKQISFILEEYLRIGCIEKASSALQELDSPHYHHELVYQAILLVLESNGDQVITSMIRLLDHFCRSVIISLDQLVTGVKRIYVELQQIQRHIPVAYVMLERFINRAVEARIIPKKIANEMPTKVRKRFVSEGDGCHNTTVGY